MSGAVKMNHGVGWWSVLLVPMLLAEVTPAWPTERPQEVRIKIRARAFHPAQVTVRVNRPVRLVFENEDVEIHAFVPEGLFGNVPVQIDGSVAPFYQRGSLVRLLIGGGAWAEVRFTPPRPGLFRYECDMPGHQMFGHILVLDDDSDGKTEHQASVDTQAIQNKE